MIRPGEEIDSLDRPFLTIKPGPFSSSVYPHSPSPSSHSLLTRTTYTYLFLKNLLKPCLYPSIALLPHPRGSLRRNNYLTRQLTRSRPSFSNGSHPSSKLGIQGRSTLKVRGDKCEISQVDLWQLTDELKCKEVRASANHAHSRARTSC